MSAIYPIIAKTVLPLLKICSPILKGLKLPIKALANMRAIVNDNRLVNLLIKDKTSSGAKVTINFVLSLIKPPRQSNRKNFRILEKAGHFPIEQPGLEPMESAVMNFLQRLI